MIGNWCEPVRSDMGGPVKAIFGPHTQRVLTFLTDLWRLTPEEINTVTRAWKEANDLNRAKAWAQVHRAAAPD